MPVRSPQQAKTAHWELREKTILSFDLETQRLLDEVGRANIHKLGLSLGVTQEHASRQFHVFPEAQASALVAQLHAADCVVGFNLHRFDYLVLGLYTTADLGRIPTVDLGDQIFDHLNRRIPLNDIAEENLGEGKSGDGREAVALFRAGRMAELVEYAKQDVRIVTDLYELALQQGWLGVPTSRGVVKVPIDCAPALRVPVKDAQRPVAPPPATPTKKRGAGAGPARERPAASARATRSPCTNCGSFDHTFDGSGIVCDEEYFANKDD